MLKPQEKNFTGYAYKDRRTDISVLWDSFKQHLRSSREHSDSLQKVAGHCSVSQSWQDREIIKEQIKNESI